MKIWKLQNNAKKVFKEEILQQLGMGMIIYIVLQVIGEFSEVVSFTSKFKEIGPRVAIPPGAAGPRAPRRSRSRDRPTRIAS